ncbi:MAG: hypothetical protein EBX41_01965, partial [Chitinophagia bacterium]|nr:hypothetical protein [Chitinophagia bacterium]
SGGACSNLLIIPGPNPVFLATKLSTVEPTQVAQVLSSTASTGTTGGYAELKNVLAANSIRVRGIRMNSTDTNIYKGNLFYGEMSLTGFQKPVKVPLSKYATTIGGGGSYDSTLIIPNLNLLLTRNFYMYISDIPASLSKLTVAFIYDKDGNSSPLTDPK